MGRDQNVNMIRHDHKGMQLVELHLLRAMKKRIHGQTGDLRHSQVESSIPLQIQKLVQGGKCLS